MFTKRIIPCLDIDRGRVVRRDVSDIVGTWKRDAALEGALREQDRVDDELWK